MTPRRPTRGGDSDGTELHVLVEEESAARALRPLLSGIARQHQARLTLLTFQGKPDLKKKLPKRLAGYATARRRGTDIRVAVLVDRDTDVCANLKRELDAIARGAGLVPRADQVNAGCFTVLNRIAVHELESWYFGDWDAVRTAFPAVPTLPPKPYRSDPDNASGKCSDAFHKLLRSSGVRMASKPQWGERVGTHLSVDRNRSTSFRAFVTGIQDLLAT